MRALRHFLLLTIICSLCAIAPGIASAQGSAQQFQTEQTAQDHCPADTVVWVNTKSGVYHFKGQRWYGNTKEGAYECRKEADGEGDRATRNGQ